MFITLLLPPLLFSSIWCCTLWFYRCKPSKRYVLKSSKFYGCVSKFYGCNVDAY